MDTIATASQEALTSLNKPSEPQNEKLRGLKRGSEAAKAILSRYPDYGRCSPEYVAGISCLLADYDDATLKTLVDRHIGVSAKCKFLPSQAEIVEIADAFAARRATMERFENVRFQAPKHCRRVKANPFPRLTEIFSDEPELLCQSFDTLFDASRSLAMHGVESARMILMAGKGAK